MEALARGHDTGSTVEMLLAPAARNLDGALVGLSARVGEERLPYRPRRARYVALLVSRGGEQLREQLGQLATVLHVVVVAHLPHAVELLHDGLGHLGMRVAQACAANARKKVQVAVAINVNQLSAGTVDELHRQTAIRVHHVFVVELDGLIKRAAHSNLLLAHSAGQKGQPPLSRSVLVLLEHGADTAVSEHLKQNGMRIRTVQEVDALHTRFERGNRSLHLGNHATLKLA